MSTLIIYMSHHGCAERAAGILARSIPGAELFNLGGMGRPDLAKHDAVVIGGSIHAGKVQGKLARFCRKNAAVLKEKRLGLFLCHMAEGEEATRELGAAFPEELRKHASATGLFGGEFDFDKMHFFEKAIVKKVAKIDKSVSRFDEKAVLAFAEKFSGKSGKGE